MNKLLAHDTNIILVGPAAIECYDAANGEIKWWKDKLSSPLALFYYKRASSMASIQATMNTSAMLSANMARSYSAFANKRSGGTYSHDTFSRMQYTRLAQSSGQSAAVSSFGGSLAGAVMSSTTFIDRLISVIVDMQNEVPLRDYAYFVVPIKKGLWNYETNTAKLLKIRLSDGATSEFPIQRTSKWCVPTAMVCEDLGLIVEAYNKFPFCKQSRTIDILRLPDTFTKVSEKD